MLTPENTSLWIVNFKREQELSETIFQWITSFPFEDINIITNYNSGPAGITSFLGTNLGGWTIKVWHNFWRENWETGSLAWCWNQAMKNSFLKKEYCIMSQDDVEIKPGWDKLITDDYLTYIAPHGDVVQIQSREGFNKIGWFDERFRAIGGCESDYVLRIMREYPGQASIHDEHIWQMRNNDVGLAEYFKSQPKEGEILQTRTEHNLKFAQKECFNRWIEKWNIHVDNLFCTKNYDCPKNWKEIDWYPSFTAKMVEEGRREPGATYADCL